MSKEVSYRQLLRFMVEMLTEAEIKEVLDYICIMTSLQEQVSQADLFDHVLANDLSDARVEPMAKGGTLQKIN